MATSTKSTLIFDHVFDKETKRHYLNGHLSVFHCHHYSSLYTQLALDAQETELLAESSEEAFYEILAEYFNKHNLTSIDERIDIACQYYAAVGLGKMRVKYLGDDGGEVELLASHVDSGWIKKWGKYDKPVNYIGVGYITAMLSAVFGEPKKTFKANERQSIVMGAETSIFNVVRR
jgi:hypothetical protein